MNDDLAKEKQLEALREQHRIIDTRLQDLGESPYQDQLRMVRLKREKLLLRDQIFALESELYPDIIA